MSQSRKILISGCGYTFWHQARYPTWAKILHLTAVPTIDVSGPAVSNQYIIDEAFASLLSDPSITDVIVQLTSMGKLDVEITAERRCLISQDTLRNFEWHGIWPSSMSFEHDSKQSWHQWLYSPGLEVKELATKVILLHDWCTNRRINFWCYQAYSVAWPLFYRQHLARIVRNFDSPWDHQYKNSAYYQHHDHSNSNTVPTLAYHMVLAKQIGEDLGLNIASLLDRLS